MNVFSKIMHFWFLFFFSLIFSPKRNMLIKWIEAPNEIIRIEGKTFPSDKISANDFAVYLQIPNKIFYQKLNLKLKCTSHSYGYIIKTLNRTSCL